MSRRGVLTAGIWCLDRNLLVTSWPPENGFAAVVRDDPCGGGSSYNLAANLKSLDPAFPVSTQGLVGDDADGAFLLAAARDRGIDASGLKTRRGLRSDYTLAFASQDTGRRTHIGAFGTAGVLTPDDFDFRASDARLIHLGLPGIHKTLDAPWQDEPNGWVRLLKMAKQVGLMTNMELVSVEPQRIAEIVRPCLPHLDLLVVNDHEIGAISGIDTLKDGETDVAACLEAGHRALALGAMELVAIHFPKGAIVISRAGSVAALPSVTVPQGEVVGANGAGDAFAAGFVYGWHEGWSTEDATRLAHAAAAASLRDMTTTGAVEDWRRCLELAQSWGWRSQPDLTAIHTGA